MNRGNLRKMDSTKLEVSMEIMKLKSSIKAKLFIRNIPWIAKEEQ